MIKVPSWTPRSEQRIRALEAEALQLSEFLGFRASNGEFVSFYFSIGV